MYLELGVGLLSAAILFAWAYAAFQLPIPPRWTGRDSLASTVLVTVLLFPVGEAW